MNPPKLRGSSEPCQAEREQVERKMTATSVKLGILYHQCSQGPNQTKGRWAANFLGWLEYNASNDTQGITDWG